MASSLPSSSGDSNKHLELISEIHRNLDSFFEETANNSQTLENRDKALEMLDKMREKEENTLKLNCGAFIPTVDIKAGDINLINHKKTPSINFDVVSSELLNSSSEIKLSIQQKVEKELNEAVRNFELDLQYPKEEITYYKPDKYGKIRRFTFCFIDFCLNLYVLKDMDYSTYLGFINTFYRTIPNFLWVNIIYAILLIGCDIYFANRKAD